MVMVTDLIYLITFWSKGGQSLTLYTIKPVVSESTQINEGTFYIL
jgi:hypothetical protein